MKKQRERAKNWEGETKKGKGRKLLKRRQVRERKEIGRKLGGNGVEEGRGG